MCFYGAAYQKSQSAVFMLPEKGVPSAVVGTVRTWYQDYAAGLEESSRGCKSSVAMTAECSRHHASRNVSWPQSVPEIVINDTINLLFKTAVSILVISNHNMVFVKMASSYFICRIYLYFSIGNDQPREPAQCKLYRHTFVRYSTQEPRVTMRCDV